MFSLVIMTEPYVSHDASEIELIMEGIVEKDISNSFRNNAMSPLKKRKMSCSAAQTKYTTKNVPLSATI